MSTDEFEKVGVLTERIDNLIERLDRFEKVMLSRFVMRVEFTPVQRLVYGGVGIVLSGVLASLLGLVIWHK